MVGALLGSWATFVPLTISILAGLASLHTWFRDQGPISLATTLALLERTTTERVSIGPVANAPEDDFPIPWVTLRGPSHDRASSRASGEDASQWLLAAARPVVVVGEEGAGKSTMARRVAAMRSHVGPRAAVYVSLANWDPSQHVLDWTAGEIATVTARRWNEKVAARHVKTLLADGRVEVIFDALDEAPEESIEAFIEGLSTSRMTGWFLFTRTDSPLLLPAYVRVVHDVIRLEPMPATTVVASIAQWGGPWLEVAARVTQQPDDDVSRLIRYPLFLTVLHTMAHRGEPPPTNLMRPPVAPDASPDIADQLMRWLVAAAVDTGGIADARQRQRWLRTLARLARRTGRDDFAWWDLSRAAPWPFPTALGTALAFLLLSAADHGSAWVYHRTGLAESFGPSQPIGIGTAVAFVAAPLLAGLSGSVRHDTPKPIRIAQSGPVRIGIAGGIMTVGIDASASGSSPHVVVITALSMALMIALVAGMVQSASSGVHQRLVRLGVAQDVSTRAFPRRWGLTFNWARLLVSLAVGLVPLLLFVLSRLSALTPGGRPLFTRSFTEQLVAGAVLAALTLALLVLGKPARHPRNHRSAVVGNAVFGATVAIPAALGTTAYMILLAWLVEPPSPSLAAPASELSIWDEIAGTAPDQRALLIALLAIAVGLIMMACAMVGLLASSAGRYALNLTVLALARRLPWRLDELLTWGHDAGILRKSGQTYSFRHDAIRRQLAGCN